MAVSGLHCHSRGQTCTNLTDRASTARLMHLHDPHPSIIETWTTPKHRPTIRSTHCDRSYQPMFCPKQPQPVVVYGQSSCNPSHIRAGTHQPLAAAHYLSTPHLLHNHRYYLLQPTLPRCLTYCYTSLPSLASAGVDQHASRRVRARIMRRMLQFYLASPLLFFPAMLTHTSRLWLWSPSIDAHSII